MDSGGSMESNEEKGAEKRMDDYLKSIGFHRKKVAKDGSCLFRAVAEQALHTQNLHTEVRANCVEFLRKNRESYEAFIEGDFEEYLQNLQDPQQWVGEVEINALAVMYKRDFLIYQEPGRPAVNITDNNFKDKVRLCFLNGNHYDSVYPISHIKSAAFCQSILYELLYEGVFKVDRSLLTSCHWIGRSSDLLSDDNMAACVSSDESDVEAADPLWVDNGTSVATRQNSQTYRGRGRGRLLCERVRRSLNPTLFRNVEYDVWHKTKRAQQKMDYCIAAGMHYTVGDRCQVCLDNSGRSYSAIIKEVSLSNGPVTVYIEELDKKQSVSLWSLRPPNEENSWSTVVRDKRLSNGHGGDWEEKGSRGRGRGKSSSASSSVAQATGSDPGGCVQKQHSWPPQAPTEEQGGKKPSRKSVSSAESLLFGLTEKERLAREEEERNVALVEIQLRDEHSFPALGSQTVIQGEGGRRKGGEKRRAQRNMKTKSPVEDVRAPSPSTAERPKSSSPPPPNTTANTTSTTANTTPLAPPAALSTNADSAPVCLSAMKPSTPNLNMAAATNAATSCPPVKTIPASNVLPGVAPPTHPALADKLNTRPFAAPTPPSNANNQSFASIASAAPPLSSLSSTAVLSLVSSVLPAASSPPIPSPSSSSSSKFPACSSSSLPPNSSASLSPISSVSPPTFIAPIAPSPVAGPGFLPSFSLPRSSPFVSLSPSSPTSLSSVQISSSSSAIHHAASLHEALNASHAFHTQTHIQIQNHQDSLNQTQIHTQASLPQIQSHTSLPQTQGQISVVQKQTHVSMVQPENQIHATLPQTSMPHPHPHLHLQHRSQSHTEGASLAHSPLPQASISYLPSQSQPETVQVQTSYPHTHQAGLPALTQPELSGSHPPPHSHPTHTHPFLQTPNTHSHTEVPPPPTQPESLSNPLPPPQYQPHPHHPAHLGAVPLHQLSQLYQDPLYPGFPQGEKGEVAPIPSYSSSQAGDDLPQDVSILRFFFNLGLKAFTNPHYCPYVYLLPLQQAHAMHPRLPSRSPSPISHYPSNPLTRHQDMYPPPQNPPNSASMVPQYDHNIAPQASPPDAPHPREATFNQTEYPVTQPPPHRMSCSPLSWQQHPSHPYGSTSYSAGYPTQTQHYPSHQGYHPGQAPGHPPYPPSVRHSPPSSLVYPPSTGPTELQASQGVTEQLQPTNGEPMPGQGAGRVPASLEVSHAANGKSGSAAPAASAATGLPITKEQGESLARPVLLVDPPLNNVKWVSEPEFKDAPVSMTTIPKPSDPSISNSVGTGDNTLSRGYRVLRKPANPAAALIPLGGDSSPAGFGQPVTMATPLLVGGNTEDKYDESQVLEMTNSNHRGTNKPYRGRGRPGYNRGRGSNRRRRGDAGTPLNHAQFNPGYQGRGRERGY